MGHSIKERGNSRITRNEDDGEQEKEHREAAHDSSFGARDDYLEMEAIGLEKPDD